ncbi:MAG: hypothetical protein FD130_2358, partial [Halothiobacillaceae bacterium]
LELPRPEIEREQLLARYEAMANPRIFKTHCTYEQTPGGVAVARIVLSSRDPRDCCLSFYHHLLGMTDTAWARLGRQPPSSFAEHVDQWLASGTWYRNVLSWWPYHKHPHLLWLRYEEMKTDLGATIERIRTFLEWDLTAQARDRVLHYSSFDWMKKHDDRFALHANSKQPLFQQGAFIRKGEVGDHRTLMSPEQSERILARAHELLPADALQFLGLAEV